MAANVRRRRIRRAFERHEKTAPSSSYSERGIGRLPKKKRDSKEDLPVGEAPVTPLKSSGGDRHRPIHPLEARLQHNGTVILKSLECHGGYLPLGDHSSPKEIRDEFAMSKRVFKRAIGYLWKRRKIDILPGKGIRLRAASDNRGKTVAGPSSRRERK